MEVLNLCYQFINRFITANELMDKLNEVDLKGFSEEEQEQIQELIFNVENIAKNNLNEEDDFVTQEKAQLEKWIVKLEEAAKSNENNEEIKKQIEVLKKHYDEPADSKERWLAIANYLTTNEYFNKAFDNVSKYDFLKFITQFIKAAVTPNIDQEEFENLVHAGIENKDAEALWRLASNYESKKMNLDSIANYFIETKDGYYLAELISAAGKNMDIDKLFDRINDKDLINYLKDNKKVIENSVTEEQFNSLIDKLN